MTQKLYRFSLFKMCDVHGVSGLGVEEELARLNELAGKGDIPAMRALGMILLSGTDAKERPAPQDQKRGSELLTKAAQSDPYAMVVLGACSQYGFFGFEQDLPKSRAFFEKAAVFDIAEGKYCLAQSMLSDQNENSDPKKYYALIEAAAAYGLIEAKLRLCDCYKKGVGVKRSQKKEIALLEELAQAGVAEGNHKLSLYYADGSHRSEKKSRDCLEKACAAGLPAALREMGWRFEKGKFTRPDLNEALRYYRLSLEQEPDHPGTLYNTAKILLSGDNAPKEAYEGEGLDCLKKAAAAEYPQALFTLSSMYLEGSYGFQKDEDRARECLLKAGEGNCVEALLMLGRFYREGTLFPKDLNESFKYYSAAAQRASSEGLYQTGLMYRAGLGCPKNESKALECFNFAALTGSVPAAFECGRALLKMGDPKKEEEALKFLNSAADAGLPAAFNLLGDYFDAKEGHADGTISEKATYYYSAATVLVGAFRYCRGGKNPPPDAVMPLEDAFTILDYACDNYDFAKDDGPAYVFCALGACYECGIGCEKNVGTAVKLYIVGRYLKDPNATLMLSELYRKGLGVQKDLKKAEELVQEAGYRIVRVGKEPEKPEPSENETETVRGTDLIFRSRTVQ